MNETQCTPQTPLRERFERTVCDCDKCARHCHHMPGCLGPGDLQRIADYMGRVPAEVLHLFRASPGALVVRQGGTPFRIGTIVPARDKNTGDCVFLDGNRCSIHEVAPFGCSHFDDHMDPAEGELRSMLFLDECSKSQTYQLVRAMVARVGGTTDGPEVKRAQYE